MRTPSDVLGEIRALRRFIRTGQAAAWAYERLARLRWTLVVIRERRHG